MADDGFVELPPFQSDTVLYRIYGSVRNVSEIIVYGPNDEIVQRVPFVPESWYDLRQMQRFLLGQHNPVKRTRIGRYAAGTDNQPYSRGIAA